MQECAETQVCPLTMRHDFRASCCLLRSVADAGSEDHRGREGDIAVSFTHDVGI